MGTPGSVTQIILRLRLMLQVIQSLQRISLRGNFWCLFEGEAMIGTSAAEYSDSRGKTEWIRGIYLDTLSSSKRAVRLYERVGFERAERYNDNYTDDIFMVLRLDEAGSSLG